jgi:hypothetical protein
VHARAHFLERLFLEGLFFFECFLREPLRFDGLGERERERERFFLLPRKMPRLGRARFSSSDHMVGLFGVLGG